ncbi:hypothetical protein [Winogradskyella rapida]|uniref:Uncharacterized protein n=1 Tax=Winogradskyella rapida TaxID=549701 RepID=A0ABW3KN46_9FLAO
MKYQQGFTTIDAEFSEELTERKELKTKLTFIQKKRQNPLSRNLNITKMPPYKDEVFWTYFIKTNTD